MRASQDWAPLPRTAISFLPRNPCDRPPWQNVEVPIRRDVSTLMTREDEDIAVEPGTQNAKQRIFRRLGRRKPPPIWGPDLLRRLGRSFARALHLYAHWLTPIRELHFHVPSRGGKLDDRSVD